MSILAGSDREGDTKGNNHDAAGSGSVEQSAGHKVENSGTPPSLKDLDENCDRDFVDALCRQAGSEVFLYGFDPRNVSTPASGN